MEKFDSPRCESQVQLDSPCVDIAYCALQGTRYLDVINLYHSSVFIFLEMVI